MISVRSETGLILEDPDALLFTVSSFDGCPANVIVAFQEVLREYPRIEEIAAENETEALAIVAALLRMDSQE